MGYIKLNRDFSINHIELPDNYALFLLSCYEILNCDSIQIMPTFLKDIVLIIDEEGKLREDWFDCINYSASYLYHQDHNFIVGDVIIARLKGPDIIPLSEYEAFQLSVLLTCVKHYFVPFLEVDR